MYPLFGKYEKAFILITKKARSIVMHGKERLLYFNEKPDNVVCFYTQQELIRKIFNKVYAYCFTHVTYQSSCHIDERYPEKHELPR